MRVGVARVRRGRGRGRGNRGKREKKAKGPWVGETRARASQRHAPKWASLGVKHESDS